MLALSSHVHKAGDGRPPRDVFVNGELIEHAIYADCARGIVNYAPMPLSIDRKKRRVVTRTLRGRVEVRNK